MASYFDHWGVKASVFVKTPASTLFTTPARHRDLGRLRHFINQGRVLCVVTGDEGTGKSKLLCHLADQLPYPAYETLLLCATEAPAAEAFLARKLVEFLTGKDPQLETKEGHAEASRSVLKQAVNLFDEFRHTEGVLVVLIDNAHELGPDALREIENCLALLALTDTSIALVLAGKPELAVKISNAKALASQLSCAIQLGPLSQEETAAYVGWHLQRSMLPTGLFSEEALRVLHLRSGGLPARINAIAENALLEGAQCESEIISAPIVESAMKYVANFEQVDAANIDSSITQPEPSSTGISTPAAGASRKEDLPLTFESALGSDKIPLTTLLKPKGESR